MDPGEERWGRRARRAGVAVLAVLLLASPLALRVGIDNRLELWVEPGSESAARYARFRASFGSSKRAHRAGLRVRELNAEISVDTAMVTANWR